jgi:hypothetical protein
VLDLRVDDGNRSQKRAHWILFGMKLVQNIEITRSNIDSGYPPIVRADLSRFRQDETVHADAVFENDANTDG